MIFFKVLKKIFNILININLKDTIDVIRNEKLLVYWSHSQETKNNFGDILNVYLLKEIFHKDVVHSSNVINVFRRTRLYFIGSILDNFKTFDSIVIGSGFKSKESKILIKPKKVYAVRGPLSRQIFLDNNVECPEVYCDPALLLPEYVKVDKIELYDVGIIPHYIDKNIFKNIDIINKDNIRIKEINIENDYLEVIKEINQCKCILSSSLHGIIVAHAYGIPSTWIKLSDYVKGDGFKFRDYYLSLGELNISYYSVDESNIDIKKAIDLAKKYDITENVNKLKEQIDKAKELYEN